ncbi:UNVERIFIED_CONTAM: hypothetical protein Slati_3817100 [Sesamum latifolium]|uniref:DUF4218 domain-containing protein n=1 Tax=Sesamum latifolium TaxID=2727402 RepID=A0AAW2U5R2_9LAMI
MKELRLHGMKSHDCHVFMQKLIPIAFREILRKFVWSALIEVSLLFQIICSTTLDVVKVQELEDKVTTILCNLEKIFLPSFFDSMEHLIVHLPYEAHVEGPVQHRWIYPFERFLRGLKMKVKNKAHVEALVVEAYLVKEISVFTSQYFEPQVLCKQSRPSRNDDLAINDTRIQQYIFNFPGRDSGASKKRWLSGSERHIIETYILTNYEVVTSYYESFCLNVRGMKVHPHYHLFDVNFKKVYRKNESFILAQQAVEVYYTEYPNMKRDKVDWMAVCKIKARRVVDDSRWTEVEFQDDESIHTPQVLTDDHNYALYDPNGNS